MSKVKLEKYISEYSQKNKERNSYPVYSATNSNGFCTEYFTKDVSSEDKSGYKLVPFGCFAYNPSRINVGSVDCQMKEENVIVSSLYTVFKVGSGLNVEYLRYFFKIEYCKYLIQSKVAESVRFNLNFDTLKSFEINYSTCVFVSKERYEMDNNIILKNNDVLITKDGTIGKVAIVHNLPGPATLNSGVLVVRPDNRFNKEYISYVFKGDPFSRFVEEVKTGVTVKHLNQAALLKFKIPVPLIKQQNEFASFLNQIDKLKFYRLIKNSVIFNRKIGGACA